MFEKIISCAVLVAFVSARNSLPDKTTNDFQDQCLKLHNYYRALHNTDPLQVDQSIVRYAKSRCSYVSQYDSLSAGHSGLELGTYGENLYWGGSTDQRKTGANDAIKAWYDEIRYYSYSNPTFSSGTGHFTQLIWKSTTRVGCALCGGQGGQWYETYVVCNYQPAGNMMGSFAQNVMPLSNGQNGRPTFTPPNQSPTQWEPNGWPTDSTPPDSSELKICRCSYSIDGNNGRECTPIS